MNWQCCCDSDDLSQQNQIPKVFEDKQIKLKNSQFTLQKRYKKRVKYSLRKKKQQTPHKKDYHVIQHRPMHIFSGLQNLDVQEKFEPKYNKSVLLENFITIAPPLKKKPELTPFQHPPIPVKFTRTLYPEAKQLKRNQSKPREIIMKNNLNSFSQISNDYKQTSTSKMQNNSTFPSQFIHNSAESTPFELNTQMNHKINQNSSSCQKGKMSWHQQKGIFTFNQTTKNQSCMPNLEKNQENQVPNIKINEITCRSVQSIADDSEDRYSEVVFSKKNLREIKSANNFSLEDKLRKCENQEENHQNVLEISSEKAIIHYEENYPGSDNNI